MELIASTKTYPIDKDTGEQIVEPHLSHYPCNHCKSHLGGDRYDVFILKFGLVVVDEYSVCADCYVKYQ